MNRARIVKTLDKVNQIGLTESGINRLAYTVEDKEAKYFIREQCELIGLQAKEDAAGNLIVRRPGLNDSLPAVAVGSHLDTVYGGGKYDGTIGVLAGLEIFRMLEEGEIKTLHPIELIVFACEESSRFNFSTLGSKAIIGAIDKDYVKQLKDKNNYTVPEVFEKQSLNFDHIEHAVRKESELKVFLELHIEQGSQLVTYKKTIGIVTGIAAPLRVALTIVGKRAHSGTTSMENRQDAFLAAAEIALKVEDAAIEEAKFGTVATVGVVDVLSSAMNVIPGKANLKIDIRSTDVSSRNRVLEKIKAELKRVEKSRKVKVGIEWMTEEEPVHMDQKVIKEISSICEKNNIPYMFMASGAGHDAMYMAKRWPAALIFVPSVNGISHHPDEFTEIDDIVNGMKVLKELVLSYAILADENVRREA
ncbi:Zn-dependent hydrolase [Halalkalibacter okhensis]|uniref:Zn-dependent hydrolase n=1 Tax=Halalkalibacter okhensis TaxID=333138 RepID=UPI000689F316|nr:Zn-dependent hydrolase [Halalkalibacter okhensis]